MSPLKDLSARLALASPKAPRIVRASRGPAGESPASGGAGSRSAQHQRIIGAHVSAEGAGLDVEAGIADRLMRTLPEWA